jgi:predicted Zn-dependent protease
VTARHGAQRQTQGTIAQVLAVGAEILGQVAGGVSGLGQAVGGVASQMIMSYGRDQELQADQLGAHYLAGNNYDPRGMIKVIQVLKNQELLAAERVRAEGKTPQKMPDWNSTHPSNDQRLAEIRQTANNLKVPTTTDAGRERYLRAINGMTFGDSRDQGVVRGNRFYHEGMGIAFTAAPGWKLRNSQESVIAVNSEGTVGTVLGVATGAGNTHEEIIQKIFKPRTGKIDKTQINGLPTSYFVGQTTAQDGSPVPLELAVIDYNNQRFVFRSLFKSVDARNAAANDLRATVTSFRPMSAADRQAAKPWQVRTVTMPAGQTIASLARSTPFGALAEAEMRVLNGVYPQGEIAPGRMVKVIAP